MVRTSGVSLPTALKRPRGWRLGILLAAFALVVAALGAALGSSSLRWRVRLVARKATGSLSELSWGELARMLATSGGYNLQVVITEGRSISAALTNPFQSQQDREQGSALFRARCAPCHGARGGGERGPALNGVGYRHGDSDWAVYRVLRDGVRGSAMAPTGLRNRQAWQVIAYLRELQEEGGTAADAAHGPPEGRPKVDVPFAAVASAADAPGDWLTYSRTLDGWRFSPLTEISTESVARLRVRWVQQVDTEGDAIEATPIAVRNVLYVSVPPSGVVALNAETGLPIWTFKRDLPSGLRLCCGKVNRGVAVVGDTVFLGTLDAMLFALDANDGHVKWTSRVASAGDGYSITAAPLVVGSSVVVGVSGGEYGIRGFLAAFDVSSGKEAWRFWTVPGPGELGHDTWQGDSWKSGGAPTWVTGSYDPATDLLYWGVGNPSPNYLGDVRSGDNLFSNSVVALDAATGRLAWHFQFTPHDEHDWDSNQTPVLAELPVQGVSRKVICWANRNGFYYVLDRATGEFLVGAPFVKQSWASGLDPHGRPIETGAARPTESGTIVSPGAAGATNWQAMAFHPALSWVFVAATEGSSVFSKSAPEHVSRSKGEFYTGSGAATTSYDPVIRALDAATGRRQWEVRIPRTKGLAGQSGLLATAGDLVFGASEGTLTALDARTGKDVWSIFLGGSTYSPPVSFAVAGRQALVAIAGRSVFLFDLVPAQAGAGVERDAAAD